MPEFTQDQVAFVTGAASGIGLAITRQLIADGITKLAVLDISSSSLSSAFPNPTTPSPNPPSIQSSHPAPISNPNIQILPLPTDVTSESQIALAVQETVSKFGRIDFCVNAAGIAGSGPVKTAELEKREVEGVLGVNLMGLWMVERAVIGQMLKQERRDVGTGLPLQTRGSIIDLGSLTSHLAIPSLAPYIMAKHGVLGLTRADALDYAAEGIRINCICPGWIKTAMTETLWGGPDSDLIVGRAPMARWGFPEEVAYMASFLLSDKASFVTGASISVDGGYGAC